MHQLNFELLEQLDIVFRWIIESDTPIPNSEKLRSLLVKVHALLEELYSSSPKLLQYSINRRKVTSSRTDEEEPEPWEIVYMLSIRFLAPCLWRALTNQRWRRLLQEVSVFAAGWVFAASSESGFAFSRSSIVACI